jgi:hypothetical protein
MSALQTLHPPPPKKHTNNNKVFALCSTVNLPVSAISVFGTTHPQEQNGNYMPLSKISMNYTTHPYDSNFPHNKLTVSQPGEIGDHFMYHPAVG